MSAYNIIRSRIYEKYNMKHANDKVTVNEQLEEVFNKDQSISGGRAIEEAMDNIIMKGGNITGENIDINTFQDTMLKGGSVNTIDNTELTLVPAKGDNIDVKDLSGFVSGIDDKIKDNTKVDIDNEEICRFASTISYGVYSQFNYEQHFNKDFGSLINNIVNIFEHYKIKLDSIKHLSINDEDNKMKEAVKYIAARDKLDYKEITEDKANLVTINSTSDIKQWKEYEDNIEDNGIVIALMSAFDTLEKQQLADMFSRKFEKAFIYKPITTRIDCCCLYLIGINYKNIKPETDSNSNAIYTFEINRLDQYKKYKEAIYLLAQLKQMQTNHVNTVLRPHFKISGASVTVKDSDSDAVKNKAEVKVSDSDNDDDNNSAEIKNNNDSDSDNDNSEVPRTTKTKRAIFDDSPETDNTNNNSYNSDSDIDIENSDVDFVNTSESDSDSDSSSDSSSNSDSDSESDIESDSD